MNNTKKIIKDYKLNLIEISIYIELEQRYPNYTSIKQFTVSVTEYTMVEAHMKKLLEKGLVDKRWEKYRIIHFSE